MAGEDRKSSSDLRLRVIKDGRHFSFYQVIRLLRLFSVDSRKGKGDALWERFLRIGPSLSLAFPPSDVERVEEKEGETPRYRVTTSFFGLYGSSSPMPTFYCEDLLEEAAEGESSARDFLDVIHHSLFELLFKCWEKYRQPIQIVENENPEHLERLFCLTGLGEKELREDVPDEYELLRSIGLFTQFPRSALGLKTLLQDKVGKDVVEIVPCVRRRAKIPDDQRLVLGRAARLGEDSYLGSEIEDRNSKFRIVIGPLMADEFQALIPGSDRFEKVIFLTRFYTGDSLVFDVELVLHEKQARQISLGRAPWSRLGRDAWLFSGADLGRTAVTFQTARIKE